MQISVSKVRYGFNNNLIINDLLIPDKKNDTLFYAKKIETKIENVDINSSKIDFKHFSIKNPLCKIYSIAENKYNFTFIIDSLKRNQSKKQNWKINCNEISISNANTDATIGSKKMVFNNSFLSIDSLYVDSIVQKLNLTDFSTELNNQSFIRKLNGKIFKNGDITTVKNFNLNLTKSELNIPETYLVVQKSKTKNKIAYKTHISQSQLYLSELATFIEPLEKFEEKISLKGYLNGNNKNINIQNLDLKTQKVTRYQGNIEIFNFYNKKEFTYTLEANKLITNKSDLNFFLSNYLNQDTTKLPSQLDILGNIAFNGEIRGTQNRIKTNGTWLSKVGKLKTNILLKKNIADKSFYVDGEISALPLLVKNILPNSGIEKTAFKISAQGTISENKKFDININSAIQNIHYNEQSLDSIKLVGRITDQEFKGRISSFDPKLRFDGEGLANFGTQPFYDFNMNLYSANLYQLNIDKKDRSANLSLNLHANFSGNTIENSTGDVIISDLFLIKDSSYFATDSISFTSHFINNTKQLSFYSEFIEGKLTGKYNTLTLNRDLFSFLGLYLPSLELTSKEATNQNIFSFEILANYPHPVSELLIPGSRIAPGTKLTGEFNSEKKSIILNGVSDHVLFKNQVLKDLKLKAYTKNNQLFVNIGSKSFNYSSSNSLKNFTMSARVLNDSIHINNNWNNWLETTYSGNINSLLSLTKSNHPKKPYLKLDIYPSNINILDTLWYVSKGFIKKDSSGITINNVSLENGVSSFAARGIISKNKSDSIEIEMKKISMQHLNVLLKKDKIKFQGLVSGTSKLSDLSGEKQINIDFYIENFGLNGEHFGNTNLKTTWDKEQQVINVLGFNIYNSKTTFDFDGVISPKNRFLDIFVNFHNQQLKVLTPYLEPTFVNLGGAIDGQIRVYGDIISPSWKGKAFCSDANFLLAPTKVKYSFTDSLYFQNHDIIFNNLVAKDPDENTAFLNGKIFHDEFTYFSVDLNVRSNRILGINTKSYDNPLFYGQVYGSGIVDIKGPTKDVVIDIAATTQSDSYFYIPLEGRSDIQDNDFIQFVTKKNIETALTDEQNQEQTIVRDAITTLNADITVTEDAEIQIIFDPRIGDALRANGTARFNLESKGEHFAMYGDYRINRGDFLFTLQNVINKRLSIVPGSIVSFSGHPLDAEIDLDAVYKVRKASVFELTQDENDKEKRVEVDCHLIMSDRLVNPTINFSVEVPSATNVEAIDQLNNLPTEDLNKQVLSLLLVNKFISLNPSLSTLPGASAGGIGATTASELLSNQLSQWLSQITTSFDLGFTYRPGDDYTAQEYELALTTKLWNERIILNGNVGYSDQQQTLSNPANTPYITDFQAELKVNKKGNIRLRAFQKVNNDITYNIAPYTQGLGIFYTEEFNSFNELLQKIFHRNAAKKPDDIELEED